MRKIIALPFFCLYLLSVLSGCIDIKNESTPAQQFSASKQYPPIPEDINGKGYFKLAKNIIVKNEITKVITNDFIYDDNGKLTKRNRQHVLTYSNGDLISSSGHKDQSGDVSYKYIYDKKRNLIEEHQYQGLDITAEPAIKIFYKNIGDKTSSKEAFNNEGILVGRETFKYDKNNNNSEISIFGENNQLRYKIIKSYDVFNNLIVRKKSNITSYYSYKGNTVTISVKFPDGTIHSIHIYTFNKNNTIDSYLRTSGDGGYWDKYVYSYNENGLPIIKVHSKKEFIIQDPYELTKYEYVKGYSGSI